MFDVDRSTNIAKFGLTAPKSSRCGNHIQVLRLPLNGSISPPYPEVTLDNFSFPVDSHLAARLVVLWPPMAKVTIDKVKNVFSRN